MTAHEERIATAVESLEHGYPDAEEHATLLSETPEPILLEYRDRLSDAIFLTEPASAMRILNVLPASFTKRHIDTYIYYLDHSDEPAYAAGAFVAFKSHSVHRTKRTAWNLDKALWKWMRRSKNAALEEVTHRLGPDWSALWPDHVAVVYGAGRLSRRLHKITAKMRRIGNKP